MVGVIYGMRIIGLKKELFNDPRINIDLAGVSTDYAYKLCQNLKQK